MLASATLRNVNVKRCKVRYVDHTVELDFNPGETVNLDENPMQKK